jgi:hypothetical protein
VVVWNPPRLGSDLQLVRRATLSSGVPFAAMHEWVDPPLVTYDYDDDAYRARPVVPGGVVFTLALRLGRTGRDLIAPWLLGQAVEMVRVVSSPPEF